MDRFVYTQALLHVMCMTDLITEATTNEAYNILLHRHWSLKDPDYTHE